MSKSISIKIVKGSPKQGPFTILDQFKNVIAKDVSKNDLIQGLVYVVDDSVTLITLVSEKGCIISKTTEIEDITMDDFNFIKYEVVTNACLWDHHKNSTSYNNYYGTIAPYVIEFPLFYTYNDEILQSVQDYTKVFTYLPSANTFDTNTRIETNDNYFNKAIVYNNQQTSGLLELVLKPKNNLSSYLQYPIYKDDRKIITFTKSDSYYQFNTFWNVGINTQLPFFTTSCESLSIDKIVNNDNMDYGTRSFKKELIRGRDIKLRLILDNRKDIHLVSQFVVVASQKSYK